MRILNKRRKIYMRILRLSIIMLTITMIASTSVALPEMLDSFNAKYNTKGTVLDTCDICHIPQPQRNSCYEECHIPNQPQKIDPFNLNPYGKSFEDHLNIPIDQALTAIEKIDSAGDKIPNINKILNLSFPGDKKPNVKKYNITVPQPTIPPTNKGDLLSVINNIITR